MSRPTSLLLVEHEPQNAPAIAQAIAKQGAEVVVFECAFYDTDPHTNDRIELAKAQVDLQQFAAGTDELEPHRKKHFWGCTLEELLKLDHEVTPFMVDAGWATADQSVLDTVLLPITEARIVELYAASKGNAGHFLAARALDVVKSFTAREEQYVVPQVKRIYESLGAKGIALVFGTDHFYLHRLLEVNGIPTAGVFTHRPTASFEVSLATRWRIGATVSQDTIMRMGLADWISASDGIADILDHRQIYKVLKRLDYEQLSELSQALFATNEPFRLGHGIGASLSLLIQNQSAVNSGTQ